MKSKDFFLSRIECFEVGRKEDLIGWAMYEVVVIDPVVLMGCPLLIAIERGEFIDNYEEDV